MNLLENIRLAISGLRAGKMRALLTMLGIIIGIGSVIAIVTVGNSLTATFTETMSEMGMNNINVGMTSTSMSEYVTIEESDLITYDMMNELEEAFSTEIAAVSVSEPIGSGQVKDGRKYANTSVLGATPGFMAANNLTMLNGRFLSDRDVQAAKSVAVISDFMANKMFGSADPLGREVKLYLRSEIVTFRVVGVYRYTPSAFGGRTTASEADTSTTMYIPVSITNRLTERTDEGFMSFSVVAYPGIDPNALSLKIEQFMNKFYEKNQNWGIYAFSMETMLEEMTTVLSNISIAIAVIAAISLLVGGIGVMNIMLVSVTERTREIGTRKALGARGSAIRIQFIVESMIICLIGGIIGVVVGLLLGSFGAGLLGADAVTPVSVVVLAVAFSMVIGIFFGYYPASKAAKLDPIDALRYE